MSNTVHSNVWQNAQLSGAPLLAMLALADAANDDGDADEAAEVVAKKARTTERHVRRIVEILDALEGVSVVHSRGRIVARLSAFAAKREPAPMVVLEAEPTTTDGLSKPDKMSVADKMSGQNVRGGQNVRNLQSAKSPPTRVLLSPPPYPEEDITAAVAAGGFASKVLDHISASLGGARVAKANGDTLAWSGQIVGLLGGWSKNDAAAAIVIWDEFRRSDKWKFKGANTSGWPTILGDWYANDYQPTVRRKPTFVPTDRR